MAEDEALPLPRRRIEAEQMTDGDAVGTRMGDESDATIGSVDLPHRQLVRSSAHATLGEEGPCAGVDPLDEVAYRLAAFQAEPALLGGTGAVFAISRFGLVARRAVPDRVADLLQPRVDHLGPGKSLQQGARGLARPDERRDEDLVELLAGEGFSHLLGLAPAPLGERGIVDVPAVTDPLRLAVSDEDDLHAARWYGQYDAAVAGGLDESTGQVLRPPAWHPDPLRRYELRYHNGRAWTADVAAEGKRYVDPLGIGATTPSAAFSAAGATRPLVRRTSGLAITSLVLGLCGVVLAWLPFLFVLGAVAGVGAVVFGVVARRHTRPDVPPPAGRTGRGMANAGLILGPLALGLAVVGLWMTTELLELVDPGEYTVEGGECAADGSFATLEGTIRNDGFRTRSYLVTVGFESTGSARTRTRDTVTVRDVAAGETERWTARTRWRDDEVSCTIVDVGGSLAAFGSG